MINKKAWIRIVEAFVAILLVLGVSLVMLGEGYVGKKDISKKVYDAELSILREIQLDDNLRNEILSIETKNLPMSWENILFPKNVKDRVIKRIPNYLECYTKICELEKLCELDKPLLKDIYAQSVGIAANLTLYDPRQLKLFCWVV